MSERVIFTGAFRFPNGDAGAPRVLGIGKSLRQAGFDVEFLGWEQAQRPEDRNENGEYYYHGFKYDSLDEYRPAKISPVQRLIQYFLQGSNTLKRLASSDLRNVKTIIAYHGRSLFLLRLALFCRRRNIQLVLDCTEWFDGSSLIGGRYGIASLDSEFRMRVVNPIIGKLIVISSYLENYYKTRGCTVFRIPPTVDCADEKWSVASVSTGQDSVLRIAYAGTPGKKDLLHSALQGLRTLHESGVSVELHLIGPAEADLRTCVDGDESLLNALKDVLVYHGRIEQSRVPSILARADFTILLRRDEQYAHAGFATKLVESLTSGVPVIANRTGDIDKFVRDGVEGILIPDHSADSFVGAVKRAVMMTPQERAQLRVNAKRRAGESFCFDIYTDGLKKFLPASQ